MINLNSLGIQRDTEIRTNQLLEAAEECESAA